VKLDPFSRAAIRWMSVIHASAYRMLGGATPLNRRILILITKGRKTGRSIEKPLWYFEDGGKLHLIASYGGNDAPPAWYLNLSANPEVEAEVVSTRRRYRARTLSSEERARIWPRIIAANPLYAGYERRTSREIPVVELSAI